MAVIDIRRGVLESPAMKKSILVYSFSIALSLLSNAAQAENICHRRAEARQHTAISQARLAYMNRVRSCQTMTSPDRAEQCIQVAKATFQSASQIARARYVYDVRICGTES